MLARHSDPIAAIATAPGRGGVGIVRISGKGLAPLVEVLCGRALQPRHATYLPFRDANGQPIDQGVALYFPAPHSYTGEDVLELQGHGGPVVMQLLLARCLEAAAEVDAVTGRPRLAGLRLAEPGEFTQRALPRLLAYGLQLRLQALQLASGIGLLQKINIFFGKIQGCLDQHP